MHLQYGITLFLSNYIKVFTKGLKVKPFTVLG